MMLLSIIIPVYNVEKYIRKTLESIYRQLVADGTVEIIVVNDGTKDNSMNIVHEYASKCGDIHVVNQDNQGLSAARNTGLRKARGKYVWFVDSDDWIEQDCIGMLLRRLEREDDDIMMFKMREYNEAGRILKERSFHDNENEEFISGTDVVLYEKKYRIDITPIQQYVIHRDFLLSNALFFVPGIYHEDKELAPRILLKAKRVVVVPKVIYCYLRRNSGSITTDDSLKKKRCQSKIFIYKRYKELNRTLNRPKDKKALSYCQYSMASYLWNELSLDFIKHEGKMLGLDKLMTPFKLDVLNNLFYDRKLLHLLRQILFLLSPVFLKRINKKL